MTQIKKTLGIAGIIALATAPAMADIASTAYVQNIVNNIPKPAAATDSAAGLTKLYTGVGTNTDGAMTQKAITDALNKKVENTATGEYSFTIGGGYETTADYAINIGEESGVYADNAIALGADANAKGYSSIAIGTSAFTGEQAEGAIQLGGGINNIPNSLSVGFWSDDAVDYLSYQLLDSGGTVPYERFAPEIPNTCKAANNQTCALVIKWNSAQNKFTQSWEVVKIN